MNDADRLLGLVDLVDAAPGSDDGWHHARSRLRAAFHLTA